MPKKKKTADKPVDPNRVLKSKMRKLLKKRKWPKEMIDEAITEMFFEEDRKV